jgi:type I restriction enzyme S subunit
MIGWRECRLGDLCEITRGASPRPIHEWISDIGTPWVKISDATSTNSRFIESTKEFIKSEGENYSVVVDEGDLILSNSATPGLPRFLKIRACIHDGWLLFRNVKNLDKLYLYYLLIADREKYVQLGNGSIFTNLKTEILKEHTFLLPPLPEQKVIAEVLSSLDDKIDLLTRQNKTLEDLAQTYFRKWFVEDASEEWEVARLGDILESIESGSRPKGGIDPELVNGVPSIGAESINGLGVYDFSKTKYVTRDFFNNMRRGVVKSHDVLVYKDGAYVGRKGMFGNDFPFAEFAVNEHVFILRSNEKAGQIFLYFLLQEEELAQLNSNSAQPGLNQQAMKAYEIVLPPKKLINDFETFAEPLIDKIFENAKQMRTLRKLRDTLLPKLISGEVRVKQ